METLRKLRQGANLVIGVRFAGRGQHQFVIVVIRPVNDSEAVTVKG